MPSKNRDFDVKFQLFFNLYAAACLVSRILFANVKEHKKINIFFFWRKEIDPAEVHFDGLEVQKMAILTSNFDFFQSGRRGLPGKQNFICQY